MQLNIVKIETKIWKGESQQYFLIQKKNSINKALDQGGLLLLVPEVVDRGEFIHICGCGLGEIPAIQHRRDSTASLFNLLIPPFSLSNKKGGQLTALQGLNPPRFGSGSVSIFKCWTWIR